MKCQVISCDGKQPGTDDSTREATLWLIQGSRTLACEPCARYWMNAMPNVTWIAPLSAYPYVDHYERAKGQMNAYLAGQRSQAAPSSDHPHPADWPCDDLCRTEAPEPVRPQRVIQATVSSAATEPSPPAQSYSRLGFPTSGPPRRPLSTRSKWLWIGGGTLASIALGIFMIVWGNTHHRTWFDSYYDEWHSPSNYALIAWGVFFILVPFLIAIITAICLAISAGARAHRQWLSQFPPEQQKRIRAAEQAAMAAGAYALHRHMRQQHLAASARLSSSVIGDGGQQWQPGPSPAAQRGGYSMDQQTLGSLETLTRSAQQRASQRRQSVMGQW